MAMISLQFYSALIVGWTLALSSTIMVNAKPTKSSDNAVWEHLNKTCLSRECDEHVNIKHLQHLEKHMDHRAQPCENFHEYACGHWKTQHDESTMMAVGEKLLIGKYQKIFAEYRERSELRRNRVYQKLQQYYDVCLLSERKEKVNWLEYIHTLRAMGLLRLSNETHWLSTLRDLSEFSNMRFFIYGDVERFNASMFMLNLYPHDNTMTVDLSKEIYEILRYFNYTEESREGIERSFTDLEMDLSGILNSTSLDYDNVIESDESDWMTWDQLLQLNSSLNWQFLLAPFPLAANDIVAVNNLTAMEKIKNYLDTYSQQTLFLYSLTRFLNHLENLKYNVVVEGSSSSSCLRHMRKTFPLAMNYIYDTVFYDAQERSASDAVIISVFQQLKDQFALRLKQNPMQLDCESLEYLSHKLKALELNIGNLPKNTSQEFYEEFIGDLNVTSHQSFYRNHLESLRHFYARRRHLASKGKFSPVWNHFNLHMPDMPDNFDTTPYYLANANIIVLPFAYLQLPFYDHRFWPSLVYGDLANTLGHELIHAFDSYFLRNDYGGNYNENESLEILKNPTFQRNLKCLEQIPTKFINERIADISGTRLALNAFAKDPVFMKHNGKLFFLQFAQFFCGSADEETFATLDPLHDMDSMRLNYALAHMPEFSEVFQCPTGSPMNPQEKCELW
ncbi:neprilysin-like 4 [Haematobia irritans]|uniref:neprilysin-like 4 n=1 Tax=Haematobia irritans TaxID=7368 RepID=UPI003F509BEA